MYLFDTEQMAKDWAKAYGWSYPYRVLKVTEGLHVGKYEVRWEFREPEGC